MQVSANYAIKGTSAWTWHSNHFHPAMRRSLILVVSHMKYFLTAFLFFFSTASQSENDGNYGKPNQNAVPISIVSLIANPDRYHGKYVRVIGAINLEFEGNSICIHKDDVVERISKNCLWLTLNEKLLAVNTLKLRKYNGKYVLLEGVFNAKNAGHLDLYSGSVDRVWRLMLWPASKNSG